MSLFYQEIYVLVLFTNDARKFQKQVNGIMHGKMIILLNQARVVSITKVSVYQAKDFRGFNGFF